MKRLLAFAILLSACGNKDKKTTAKATEDTTKTSVVSNVDPIIGTAKKLENFEVAENDFPNLMIWDEATRACDSLGKGWRLPIVEELNAIYMSKDSLGSFTSDLYWTSSEPDEMNASTQNMFNGKQGRFSKIYMCKVRAVRSL